MVLIECRTYIPRSYGLIGFIIIGFLYKELPARARENHATTEYLQARYSGFQPVGSSMATNTRSTRYFVMKTFLSQATKLAVTF